MNKIYKVVWNAARGCFVVGSEFIRSSHTGGCGCEQKRSGCTLKRAVLTALLAGGILLPLSGAQVGAAPSWPGNRDYAAANGENFYTLDHEKWQDDQIDKLKDNQQDVSGLKGDVSDLQDDVSHLESAFENSAKKDHEQDADIGGLKEDVSGLKDDFDASKIKDHKQDAAIEMGIHKDEAQDAAIEMGIHKDEAQDAAIAGGVIHDAMQDGAIIGGMIKDAQQDAAIEMGIHKDEAQDAAIEMGIHKDEAQDAAIAGGMIHDAMQDGAIIGGMIKDAQQDAAIEMGIHKDEAQDAAIEMGIHKDEAQDAAIADGVIHDAMQDGAIIGGIIKDHQQDDRLDAVEDKNTEQDSRLDVVEEVNADQQLQIDDVRGEVGQEVADRTKADQHLQDQIDDVNDKVGDADFAETTYADGAGNVTDAIKDLDDALGEVDYKAQQHTTVTTSDSNIQMSESTNTNGGTNYDLALNPNLKVETVQAESGSFGDIQINGKDENGNATNTITGLGNTEWDANHDYTGSTQAATESQLQQAIDQTATELTNNSVQYDKNADGSVNKGSVTLGGTGSAPVHLGNVEDGHVAEGSKDAVNGGQLWNVQQQVNDNTSAISGLNSRVDTLDGRIDKVGANAAALAALHPLDFDPDDKWDFAAGVGNYGGENAMAVGAFYRPNEDTMFSVGGSFGTGENMVNAGVSFKIGQGNHVSTSRVAMAKEIETLRHNVAQLTELVNRLVGSQDQIQNAMTTPFPDVPENHWAYETIEQMRERGIVEGYPDGTFGGDRQMTCYEFATIVYRAMQKGIGMNEDIQRLVEEFKPELELIRVDTIAQDSEGRPTIERVRVNKA